jgi:hypothetical protein
MRGPNADKAGAVQFSATVHAATDCDVFAREVARSTSLTRTNSEEHRAVEQARRWLQNRLTGNAPRAGETHLWGNVERGRWVRITFHGIEDADFEYDEWPTIIHGHRDADGTVQLEDERTPQADRG